MLEVVHEGFFGPCFSICHLKCYFLAINRLQLIAYNLIDKFNELTLINARHRIKRFIFVEYYVSRLLSLIEREVLIKWPARILINADSAVELI